MFNNILSRVSTFIVWSHRWSRLLQPARACMLASLLVPVLFIGVGQGRDIVRQLVAEASYDQVSHQPVRFQLTWHVVWMYAGLFAAGLSSWAWARFLFSYEFPSVAGELQELNVTRAEF